MTLIQGRGSDRVDGGGGSRWLHVELVSVSEVLFELPRLENKHVNCDLISPDRLGARDIGHHKLSCTRADTDSRL